MRRDGALDNVYLIILDEVSSSFYSPIFGLDIRYIIIFIIFLSYECFSCLPWSMFEPLMQAEHDIICKTTKASKSNTQMIADNVAGKPKLPFRNIF